MGRTMHSPMTRALATLALVTLLCLPAAGQQTALTDAHLRSAEIEIPQLVTELFDMAKEYLRQETIEPAKKLGRGVLQADQALGRAPLAAGRLAKEAEANADFPLLRLLTGLGVGGEFAVGVALLAETMPARARPYTLAALQALSAVGNVMAAGTFILFGLWEQAGNTTPMP